MPRPNSRRFVDLSIYLENDVLSDPPAFEPQDRVLHARATPSTQIAPFFPGLTRDDLPDGEGWAVERVRLSTHNGTHLDAPYHFPPPWTAAKRAHHHRRGAAGMVLPAGRQARLPPLRRRLCGDRRRRRGRAEAHRPRAASRCDIVLVNTAAGARYGQPDYVRDRLRHGPRGDAVSTRARRAAHRHGRLELGRAVRPHGEEVRRDARREAHLGGPQGRPRDRLLPHREAAQPGGAAGRRLHRRCFPREDHAAPRPAGPAPWRSSTIG